MLLWIAGMAEAGSARIEPLTPAGQPNVQARSAVAMDIATAGTLYTKDADAVRAIASTSKIFVAMVVRRRGIELDALTAITTVDRDHARGGARTRLEVHHSFHNIDLLRAMLIASDNRAPTALGRAVGLEPKALIAAMNELATELGLVRTRFTDPSGLNGNVSTAREMAIAFRAALKDPLLAEIMGARTVSVRSSHSRPRLIHYRNTNRALHSPRYQVLGGKTGFTSAAGYCLLVAAEVDGRALIMVFLGEEHDLTRYGDFERVTRWVLDGRAPPLDRLPNIAARGPTIDAAAVSAGEL